MKERKEKKRKEKEKCSSPEGKEKEKLPSPHFMLIFGGKCTCSLYLCKISQIKTK